METVEALRPTSSRARIDIRRGGVLGARARRRASIVDGDRRAIHGRAGSVGPSTRGISSWGGARRPRVVAAPAPAAGSGVERGKQREQPPADRGPRRA
eukprot:5106681-Pyramimonas_sp.AAC.1